MTGNKSLIVAIRKEAVSSPEGVKFLALEDIEGIIRAHQAEQPQDMVERVAKAICPLPVPWDKLNDDCKEIWRGYAKAAIAAMGGASETGIGNHASTVHQQDHALTPSTTDTLIDWTEDFPHENGNYQNICTSCGRTFIGHKRRPICKECASRSEISAHPALANAAEILANFKGEPDSTKLEEWQAAYARLFTQMNDIYNQREIPMIDGVKPGSLNIDVDATLKALNTQYQFCADAIIPRHSDDAPDLRQLGMIRDAHLNISRILRAYKELAMKREAIGHFDILRSANKERQKEWDKGGNMTLSYMGNELAGETGELCNVVKKLEREVFGMAGSRATIGMAQQEAADVVICIDLLAARLGFDLWGAVVAKFNYTSEKNGFITKIEGGKS